MAGNDGKRVLFCIWETRVQDYDVFATEIKQGWLKPTLFTREARDADQ
jgi:hypothetical protein